MDISRRKFVAGMSATALAAAAGTRTFMQSYRREYRPNIILFIADDMTFDAAGFAGNSIIRTPHMDKLANEGFVFDNNFVTTSVCPISRASIMTGDYALRHRVYGFRTPLTRASLAHSFPHLLRKAGYYTGFIGKWGMGGPQPAKMFDVWHEHETSNYFSTGHRHLTDIETAESLRFIRGCPANRPFLLIVSFKAPHDPLTPQPRFANMYDHVTIPKPRTDTGYAVSVLPPLLRDSWNRKGYFVQMGNDAMYQSHMRNYYALITGVDDAVGRITALLAQKQMMENTSIVLTSDNGMMEGAHGLVAKSCMYEDSIRVPLLVRPAPAYFSTPVPARCKAMSLNIDIAPTLLSMASVPVPPHIQGKNLLPVLQQPDMVLRKGFYYEHPVLAYPEPEIVACQGFRTEVWKYARYARGRQVNECLFNLQKDPLELKNLAYRKPYKQVLIRMRAAMMQEKNAIRKA